MLLVEGHAHFVSSPRTGDYGKGELRVLTRRRLFTRQTWRKTDSAVKDQSSSTGRANWKRRNCRRPGTEDLNLSDSKGMTQSGRSTGETEKAREPRGTRGHTLPWEVQTAADSESREAKTTVPGLPLTHFQFHFHFPSHPLEEFAYTEASRQGLLGMASSYYCSHSSQADRRACLLHSHKNPSKEKNTKK